MSNKRPVKMNVWDSSSDTNSSSSSDEEPVLIRRRKIYKERQDYLAKYDEDDFFSRFRLQKATTEALLHEIEDLIKLPTTR